MIQADTKLVHQQIVSAALLHPKCLVSFSRIPFPETIKLRIRGILCARKNSCRTCHYEDKRCKALWLLAREVLLSNCNVLDIAGRTSSRRRQLQRNEELPYSLQWKKCNTSCSWQHIATFYVPPVTSIVFETCTKNRHSNICY